MSVRLVGPSYGLVKLNAICATDWWISHERLNIQTLLKVYGTYNPNRCFYYCTISSSLACHASQATPKAEFWVVSQVTGRSAETEIWFKKTRKVQFSACKLPLRGLW